MIDFRTMTQINRQAIHLASFLMLTILVSSFLPTICNSLTHAVHLEVSIGLDHTGNVHHHEHGAEHHSAIMNAETPAIVNQANETLIRLAMDHNVLKNNTLSDGKPDSNQIEHNFGRFEHLIPPVEQIFLMGNLSNAPPA